MVLTRVKQDANDMMSYFANIKKGKLVLWCYLIWYCVTLYFHFDSSLRLWLNSLGISFIIGIALMLSVANAEDSNPDVANDRKKSVASYWQTFRLFMMPFCVSSFSSLIKDQGYILIIPPDLNEQLVSVGTCIMFLLFVLAIKWCYKGASH